MAKQNYNCSEQELYTICETAWISCRQFQTRFSTFKPKYTNAFIDARLLEVEAARLLPDEQQRNEAYESASVLLKKAGRVACDSWQFLKRYIADAYEADLHKPKWEAAGYNYYEKASNNNWDSVKGLMTSGLTFINANLTQLTANDNMPPSFPAEFETAKVDFEKLHQEFIQAEEESRTGQETKMNANNGIHASLMIMLLDGQEIFKNEEAALKQFIFAELLYLASGAGTAGVKGQITDEFTAATLPDISVTISGTSKSATSTDKGRYEITQMAAGKYNITFQGQGYESQTIVNHEVKVGTVSTLNIKMKPLPENP